MLFNSLAFLLFLPTVFILYWFLFQKSLKAQNLLVVVASYVFYGWWDYRFLALLFLSTLVDYVVGLRLHVTTAPAIRKRWMWVSVGFNLGMLGFFKYFNFFVSSFVEAFSRIGYDLPASTLHIILPIGISFYTFQTMSYTLDIYKEKLTPTKDFIAFSAFVAFFPQLVAGPIERASNLLPQVLRPRKFEYRQGVEGIRLMLWGLFKKIVIADALAPTVNDVFANYESYPSGVLIMGAVFFAFQIYGDFSGYSDIARGLAKLLGFELMINFNYPYFSRSIAEFWRRWHISLSTWFRDYVYIPLGGSRVDRWTGIRNIFIIFLVSGFWHGANWTFLIWGGIHAALFLPSFVLGYNRTHIGPLVEKDRYLPSVKASLQIFYTFTIVTVAWVFFRADNFQEALNYIRHAAQFPLSFGEYLNPYDNQLLTKEFILLFLFLMLEFLLATEKISLFSSKSYISIFVDATLLVLILNNLPVSKGLSFIYFQF